ncbi:hypothetical protein [Microvirga sp. 2TAF3]|uniref:hypothetical protein n=1 Tax=Microvirga sp. 2TAF3 TaxID=3233014 RepID=UPI003F9AB99D
MTKSYSLDLRPRVARFVEADHSCHAAARASDPKVDSTFGINPMLISLSGASVYPENRVHFSARCSKTYRTMQAKFATPFEDAARLEVLIVPPSAMHALTAGSCMGDDRAWLRLFTHEPETSWFRIVKPCFSKAGLAAEERR